jgi:hypothetical protein
MTSTNVPNLTQEARVLKVLIEADGKWVNKQYFIREMMLTQAGRAIYNLENNPEWVKQYEGYKIDHSSFRDEFGFKSYRLIKIGGVMSLFDGLAK